MNSNNSLSNDIACLHGGGDKNKSLYQLLPVVMKN